MSLGDSVEAESHVGALGDQEKGVPFICCHSWRCLGLREGLMLRILMPLAQINDGVEEEIQFSSVTQSCPTL